MHATRPHLLAAAAACLSMAGCPDVAPSSEQCLSEGRCYDHTTETCVAAGSTSVDDPCLVCDPTVTGNALVNKVCPTGEICQAGACIAVGSDTGPDVTIDVPQETITPDAAPDTPEPDTPTPDTPTPDVPTPDTITPDAAIDVPPAGPITLGGILDLSGPLASFSVDVEAAAMLAIDEINAAGGLLGGRQLILNVVDDGTDVAMAADAVETLVALGVPATIGPMSSAIALSVSPALTADDIVAVSPSATSPLITTLDDDGFFFRTAMSDDLQGKLLAQLANDDGCTTAAIAYIDEVYGDSIATAFVDEYTTLGGAITYNGVLDPTGPDVQAAEMIAALPGCILLAGYPTETAPLVASFYTTYQFETGTLLLPDALASDGFVTDVGGQLVFDTLDYVGVSPSTWGPAFDDFSTAFSATTGGDPAAFAANAYDAVYLIALAIEQAGVATGPGIRDALQGVSDLGTEYTAAQFGDARDAITTGADVDYVGASGDVDFDAEGDVTTPFVYWGVSGGAIEYTTTVELQ